MINENILKLFQSNLEDPNYIIVINELKNGERECNQDSLILKVKQINGISLNDIFPNNIEGFSDEDKESFINKFKAANWSEKELDISSNLTINENSLYSSELIGYYKDKKSVETIQEGTQTLSRNIEIINTKLNKTIDVEFEKNYTEKPNIIVNVDKKDESLYSKYHTDYKTDNDGKYIGVEVSFDNLKTKNEYPIIGLIIIGDKK